MFFQLFSTINVKLVDEMMQINYLCVIVHVKHNKLPFLAVLTWFLILGKIEDGGNDGDHCRWRHRPPAAPAATKYTSSCWEDQRLFTKGKVVSKYCSISKTPGGVPSTPSPPCTTVEVWICVYVLGLNALGCKKKIKLWTNLKKTKHLKEAIDAILCLCQIKYWS